MPSGQTMVTNNIMIQMYYKTFYQTFIYNVATISAIIVGIVSFAMRKFNENNGKEKVRKVILTILDQIDTIIIKMMDLVSSDVTVDKPSTIT